MNIDTYLNSGITGRKNKKQPLVSVIVPAYNVEDYIEECITSILSQTYDNLELFIVDDGSTDSTPSLIDTFAKNDERIIAIHQENRGIGGARNAALERMTGEYVLFVDSDDWIPNYAIEMELYYLFKEKAEMAAFKVGYSPDGVFFPLYEAFCGKIRRMNSEQLCRAYLGISQVPLKICVWNKIYKSSIWKKKRFTEDVNYEDLDVMFWILHDIKKAVYINEFGYVQRVRPGSVIQSYIKKRDLHLLAITDHMIESAREWFGVGHKLYKWTFYKATYEEVGLLERISLLINHQYRDSDLTVTEVENAKEAINLKLRERFRELEKNARFYGKKYKQLERRYLRITKNEQK